jgi:hypothetical protein
MFENWRTVEQFDRSLTQKYFVLSALLAFLDLALYGLFAIPFQHKSLEILQSFGFPLHLEQALNANSFQNRFFYYIVTAQVYALHSLTCR